MEERIELAIDLGDRPAQTLLQGEEQSVEDRQLEQLWKAPAKQAELVFPEEGPLCLEESWLVALIALLKPGDLRRECLLFLLQAVLPEAEGRQRQPNERGERENSQPEIMQASVEDQQHINKGLREDALEEINHAKALRARGALEGQVRHERLSNRLEAVRWKRSLTWRRARDRWY
jgi:hypothetical protein